MSRSNSFKRPSSSETPVLLNWDIVVLHPDCRPEMEPSPSPGFYAREEQKRLLSSVPLSMRVPANALDRGQEIRFSYIACLGADQRPATPGAPLFLAFSS